jgi:hypothetical protein
MTMNPNSDHLDDELLSAHLDGDRAATDSRPDAAAHVRGCDRCAARQAELAGARTALAAAPVEPLDELARRRLVAAALAAATEGTPAAEATAVTPIGRSRWARRHPALIGSAAAAVLAVLVGVPFVMDNGQPNRDETAAAQAPLQNSAGTFLGDLGDLSDRDRLRLRLSGAAPSEGFAAVPAEPGPPSAAGAPAPAPMVGAAPGSGGAAGSSREIVASTTMPPSAAKRTAAPEGTSDNSSTAEASSTASADQAYSYPGDQSARDRADTDACVAALLNGPAKGGRLTRAGTGTYRGRPAIVASFELSGGNEAFITDRSGCAVLDRFSV